VALGYAWVTSQDTPVEVVPEARAPEPQAAKIAVLSASHDIASGTLLQQGDMLWKDVAPLEIRPGNLVRGQASEAEFVGALAKRDFASGEALISGDLLKHNDRRFLAAALKLVLVLVPAMPALLAIRFSGSRLSRGRDAAGSGRGGAKRPSCLRRSRKEPAFPKSLADTASMSARFSNGAVTRG